MHLNDIHCFQNYSQWLASELLFIILGFIYIRCGFLYIDPQPFEFMSWSWIFSIVQLCYRWTCWRSLWSLHQPSSSRAPTRVLGKYQRVSSKSNNTIGWNDYDFGCLPCYSAYRDDKLYDFWLTLTHVVVWDLRFSIPLIFYDAVLLNGCLHQLRWQVNMWEKISMFHEKEWMWLP